MRSVNCFLRGITLKFRRKTARANISGVASGLSERSISSSFMASMRFQSVCDFFEVLLFLIFHCLSKGYDSNNFICFGMDNRNDSAIQNPKRQHTSLAVIKAIVHTETDEVIRII